MRSDLTQVKSNFIGMKPDVNHARSSMMDMFELKIDTNLMVSICVARMLEP